VEDRTKVNAFAAVNADETDAAALGAGNISEQPSRGRSPVRAGSKDVAKKKQAARGKLLQPREQTGLELGRRLLVVLTTPTQPADKPCPWCHAAKGLGRQTQALRVVDHGVTQKEAIRRLFDAQVLLRSYEEQLQALELDNKNLQIALKEKKAKECLRENAEIDSLVLDETEEERKQKEAELQNSIEARIGLLPAVPYWLRGDQRSRESIEVFKTLFMRAVQEKGERLEAVEIADKLWQLGYAFALRWAGGPDEEIVQQNKDMVAKFKKIQRAAMLETDMLRQHIRRLEAKHKELQNNAKKMKDVMKHAQDYAAQSHKEAARWAQIAHMCQSGVTVDEALDHFEDQDLGERPLHSGAAAIVAGWMKGGGAQDLVNFKPPGSPSSHGAGVARGPSKLNLPAGGGGGYGPVGGRPHLPSFVGGSGGASPQTGFSSPAAATFFQLTPQYAGPMNFNYDEDLDRPPTNEELERGIKSGNLEFRGNRDLEEFGASMEELEQMDHEIYEPLNAFDPDQRELMIDAVNAKVRRILMLDPSKFQNGRLPFGLRPDNESELEAELRAQIRNLMASLAATEEERDILKSEVDDLRRRLEEMRRRRGLSKDPPPEAPPPPKREIPKEIKETPPVQTGIPQEEVDRLIEEAREKMRQEMMKKIRELEDLLARRERELEELKKRIAELMKTTPDYSKDDEIARLKAMLKRLQEQLDEARKGTVPSVEVREVEKIVVEEKIVYVNSGEDTASAKKGQELLHRLLLLASKELDVAASAKGQKAVEKVLGTVPGEKAETDNKLCDKAIRGLEAWSEEVLAALEGTKKRLQAKLKAPPPEIIEKIITKTIEVPAAQSPREGKCYIPAHKDLEKRLKDMEDQMSKLLLTVDEMRRRIEKLQDIPFDPEEEEESEHKLGSIMERVGLKELAEAKEGPKLKGVFERLYQDACQRIVRSGMVRERVLLANKAYSAALTAINTGDDPKTHGVPDFERLNETTKATLKGMWYHSDYMFKRCCEYAMTQGVEPQLLKTQHEHELEDTGVGLDEEMPRTLRNMRSGLATDRLATRHHHQHHRERPRAAPPASASVAGTSARSPAADLYEPDSGPTNFKAYMQAMRDAQAASLAATAAAKASQERRLYKQDSSSSTDMYKTLKAACGAPGSAGNTALGSLSSSRSLPALPKGRSISGSAATTGAGGNLNASNTSLNPSNEILPAEAWVTAGMLPRSPSRTVSFAPGRG